jgi:oligoendopeptidase F
MKKRQEVLQKDKWNVEALFGSFEQWEMAFAAFDYTPLKAFQGTLSEGPAHLASILQNLFSLSRELEKLYTYAHLRHDEDTKNDLYKEAYQKITLTHYDFAEKMAWLEPELLALPEKALDSYLKSKELEPYRFYLEKIIHLKPHTLSESEERLMALSSAATQSASKAFGALNNADIKFEKIQDSQHHEHELSHGSYQLYLRSHDRTLRKNAYQSMHQSFKAVENTLAELIYGQVQSHVFQAKSRKYNSCLEAALFPKNIPVAVYHNLIRTVKKHLPSLHRYVALRKKTLNVDTLHVYDLYVPLVKKEDHHLTYEEAEKWVIESTAPLGQAYQSALREGMQEQGWVDRFENSHKRSGAYSSGCYDSFPYILMNYKGILKDMFTLAHEAGHSMHSYLSHKHQAYHDSHYPIFVAEVASTFNEELLMDLLMKSWTDEAQQLYLTHEKLEDIRGTIFRQTLFAEFELTIHESVEQGQPLTPHFLSELYNRLQKEYYGPDLTLDPVGSIEWARIPHFYYNFYVYQYATGLSAALALSKKVLEGDTQARDRYLRFLQGGGHLYPVDLLKLAGIDMTQSEPIESALSTFDGLVTRLEKFLS